MRRLDNGGAPYSKIDWAPIKAFVADGKTLAEASRAFKIPIGTVTMAWSRHKDWPRPARETVIAGMLKQRLETKLLKEIPDLVSTITERNKQKAAVFSEVAGRKLLDVANFVGDSKITSRKDALNDAIVIKTAAQAAEIVLGMKKDTPQQAVMINLGGLSPSAETIQTAQVVE